MMTDATNQSKPKLKLIGTDGNAFALLGAALRAARTAKWAPEQVERFKVEATKGDYFHLLHTLQQYFEVD